MASVERVMRDLTERGFATNLARRGIWRAAAPMDFSFDFTATRQATGRPSVPSSLWDHPRLLLLLLYLLLLVGLGRLRLRDLVGEHFN